MEDCFTKPLIYGWIVVPPMVIQKSTRVGLCEVGGGSRNLSGVGVWVRGGGLRLVLGGKS